jgi:hypothetical protein
MRKDSSPEKAEDRDCLEGRYSNYFKIGHNAFEFIFDFGQSYDDNRSIENIHSRIVTSPAYAKDFLVLLSHAIEQYENEHDDIV